MAARKASRATGEEGVAATVIPGDVAAELTRLRQSIDQLTQGLTQLVDTAATHTAMLQHVLAAITEPTEPENDVAILLRAIVARLADQSVLLRTLDTTMTHLPEAVGAAMSDQLAAALAAVK
jgi:hypothetical protein